MKTLKTLTIILTLFTTSMASAQQKQDNKSAKPMKMYLIEREMPGAGKLTLADLQGASQKSNEVLKEMGSGIEWINSYVVDDKLYCVYKAESKELIKEHAEKGGFPCNSIMEIKESINPSTAVTKTN